MSTPTAPLPAGTQASDLSWNDEDKVDLRIAFHEARLGLPKLQVEYIDTANYYLHALAVSQTRAEAEERIRTVSLLPSSSSEEAPTVVGKPAPSTPTLTGYDRLAQAFASGQPSSSPLRPAAPVQSEVTGVGRLAAYYARAAKTSPNTNH